MLTDWHYEYQKLAREDERLRAEVERLRACLEEFDLTPKDVDVLLPDGAREIYGQWRADWDQAARDSAEVERLKLERDAIQAVAVKLQAYIYTDDTQDRSYDEEALAAVRKKAGLGPAPTEGGTR